ncbi:MAG TPA: hypothetical protein VGR37_01090, partial [Longimicrobiaceae bacterium]|nr:hypothetical protein [Longimicrobiaceae bacterium]
LSFSVLADSAMEHYRGGFYNPAMFVAPAVSALTLGTAARALARGGRVRRTDAAVYGAAALAGLAGTGFHTWNVLRRTGGLRWENVFYGAPVGAPLGITYAGLYGLAARHAATGNGRPGTTLPPLLGWAAAAGLAGTAAEAGLLHFRGAFQDPVMYLPVTVPPLAALALGAAVARPSASRRRTAVRLLWGTVGMGLAGVGFHAVGVARNMGGWKNWSQNLLQGPPLPAPPSFTGMALAGLAAIELMEGGARA